MPSKLVTLAAALVFWAIFEVCARKTQLPFAVGALGSGAVWAAEPRVQIDKRFSIINAL